MRSVKIQLLEKERGNSGRNRTIKKIPSYTTNNNAKQRERERGGGRKEGEGKSEWVQRITAVALCNFALVKSRSKT